MKGLSDGSLRFVQTQMYLSCSSNFFSDNREKKKVWQIKIKIKKGIDFSSPKVQKWFDRRPARNYPNYPILQHQYLRCWGSWAQQGCPGHWHPVVLAKYPLANRNTRMWSPGCSELPWMLDEPQSSFSLVSSEPGCQAVPQLVIPNVCGRKPRRSQNWSWKEFSKMIQEICLIRGALSIRIAWCESYIIFITATADTAQPSDLHRCLQGKQVVSWEIWLRKALRYCSEEHKQDLR